MNSTSNRILDTALELIQTRGYSAISYNDIATALGIRKASIHYHFATKSDLGVAVVKHYADNFSNMLEQAEQSGRNSWKLLDAFLVPFREFNNTPDRICLCATLAGEFLALPLPVQKEVSRFFESGQEWLEGLIKTGRRKGEFQHTGVARKEAQLFFSALQGALLVKRTTGNPKQLEYVITALKARLKSAG